MKLKFLVLSACSLSAFLLQAGVVWKSDAAGGTGGWGDGTRWEGDVAPTANAEVEIPAGEAVVTDADVVLYRSLAKVTLTDAESRLVFRDTTMTEPFVKDGFLCGSVGTVVKDNAITWQPSVSSATYTGAFDIKSGKVALANKDGLGSSAGTAAKPTGAVYIRSGAQIAVGTKIPSGLNTFTFGFRPVHLAGNGPDGNGAVYQDKNETIASLMHTIVLDDDASIGSVGGYFGLSAGTLDFNGNHKLSTACDYSYCVRVENMNFVNSVADAKGVFEIGTGSATKLQRMSIQGASLSFGNTDAVSVRLVNKGNIHFRGDGTNYQRPACPLVIASEGATISDWNFPNTPAKLACADWAGPVVFEDGMTLSHTSGTAGYHTRISGKISGYGYISIPETDICSQLQLLNEENDFEGDVTVNGKKGGALKAFYPGSIPETANVKLENGGHVTLVAKNWTLQQIFDFTYLPNYLDVNHNGYGLVAIDPEGCTAGDDADTLRLALDDGDIRLKKDDVVAGGLGVDGKGTLELTAGPENDRLRLAAYDGTLRLANGTFKTDIVLATSYANVTTGVVEVVDAEVDTGTGSWTTGYHSSEMSGNYGIMRLTNARMLNHHSTTCSSYDGFIVGRYARGDLFINGDCAITNHLQAGWGQTGGRGRIVQNGGYFHAWGREDSAAENGHTILGNNGAASYELNGGTFAFNGYVSLGWDHGSSGAFYQHGGVVTNTVVDRDTSFSVGCHWGGSPGAVSAIYYNDGGRFDSPCGRTVFSLSRDGTTVAGADKGAYAVAAVDDPAASVSVENITRLGGSPNSTSILDLNNGGVWRCWRVSRNSKNADTGRGYVNFDGGELITVSGPLVLGSASDPDRLGVNKTTVFAHGATVGTETTQSLGVPLEAPTGNGVTSINWTDTTTAYPCAPTVVITDDGGNGYGASAVALYETETGHVTGIKVLSPGCNYSNAKAAVRWGAGQVVTVGCTLGANVTTGGVTFKTLVRTTAKLTIDVANTYNGPTAIDGIGTVIVGSSSAFGHSKELTLAGATLDLGDYSLEGLGIEKIHFQGGAVTASTLPVALPAACEYPIDLERVAATGKYAVPANVTCPDAFTLQNGDKADPTVGRYTLLTVPAGYAGIPEIAGVPTDWTLRRVGNDIVITWRRPMALLLR